MSEIKVNKISPRTACGTVTLGDSGDTFTIPSGATITNAGTASGFGATGETSWDTTVKTTGTFTATAGVGYFLNTTGGTITVNLPAGAAGSSVALADYAATWNDNKVTVSPNGSEKIGGVNADAELTTQGQSVTFVYIDGTQGWVNVLDSTSNVRPNEFVVATVSGACNTLATAPDCANVKIATFVNPGTFCVSEIGACAANNLVSYAVVGGGGGGPGNQGGGGGAGGYREVKSPITPYTASPLDGYATPANRITVTATGYPITVGGGGGATPSCAKASDGSSSTASTITSAGGGAGGARFAPPSAYPGNDGGSGGGGGGCASTGGSGNTPSVSPAQGTDGADNAGPDGAASGGGGATVTGTVGGPGRGNPGGAGGAGATTSITGSPVAYAGGGGGGEGGPPGPRGKGAGGTGGGGCGAFSPPGSSPGSGTPGTAGTTNRGGGGGGGGNNTVGNGKEGGAGGSGIVIIRYKFQ